MFAGVQVAGVAAMTIRDVANWLLDQPAWLLSVVLIPWAIAGVAAAVLKAMDA